MHVACQNHVFQHIAEAVARNCLLCLLFYCLAGGGALVLQACVGRVCLCGISVVGGYYCCEVVAQLLRAQGRATTVR